MNGELLNVLEFIEREKGIDKEILIKAVENSLLSAARKSTEPIAKKKNLSIQVDRETGNIKTFAELTVIGKNKKPTSDEISITEAVKIKKDVKAGDTITVEVTTKDFGRIAAQTAKQVIIQKIREAERDLVYNEFKERVGDITLGVIRHKERGNIIVDLGRAEAILPPKEQSSEERYRIGNRIRAYVVDVKPTPKGPEILLSRTHVGLVKCLFELEVPEITDGIVEIKRIAREAGLRTKVAVCSNDPKVDPVGACVGMRGSRVKNIVRELEPEKLDIIKWESDITAYATNALSPAKLEKILVNEKEKKLEIFVAEDQLSVAIGKRGQNVRLASKLTGWSIDIRKVEEEKVPEAAVAAKGEKEAAPETAPQPEPRELVTKLNISSAKAEALIKAGLSTLEKIAGAKISELTKLKGFGKKTVVKIKEKAQELLQTKDQRRLPPTKDQRRLPPTKDQRRLPPTKDQRRLPPTKDQRPEAPAAQEEEAPGEQEPTIEEQETPETQEEPTGQAEREEQIIEEQEPKGEGEEQTIEEQKPEIQKEEETTEEKTEDRPFRQKTETAEEPEMKTEEEKQETPTEQETPEEQEPEATAQTEQEKPEEQPAEEQETSEKDEEKIEQKEQKPETKEEEKEKTTEETETKPESEPKTEEEEKPQEEKPDTSD